MKASKVVLSKSGEIISAEGFLGKAYQSGEKTAVYDFDSCRPYAVYQDTGAKEMPRIFEATCNLKTERFIGYREDQASLLIITKE